MSVHAKTDRHRSPLMRQHDDAPAPEPVELLPDPHVGMSQEELDRIWKTIEDACKG